MVIENKVLKYEKKEALIEDVKNILSEKYFYFFSKTNKYFFPQANISEYILDKYKGIYLLEMYNFNQKLVLSIKERGENYYYCTDVGESCYFVDAKGKIFNKISGRLDPDKILFFRDDQRVAGDDIFNDARQGKVVLDFIDKMSINFHISFKKIKLSTYKYIFTTKNGVQLIFSNENDVDMVIEKLKKGIKSGKIKIESNHQFSKKIKYIDLTFPKRINFCLKGQVCDEKK